MIIFNIICKYLHLMLISQGSFRVCKNHSVILLILLTLLEKLVMLLNLLKKNQQLIKISPGHVPRCAMCTLRLWFVILITNRVYMIKQLKFRNINNTTIDFSSLVLQFFVKLSLKSLLCMK